MPLAPRLLFVVEHPFSPRDETRFGIAYLRMHFDVEVLDAAGCGSPVYRHPSYTYEPPSWVRIADTVDGAVALVSESSPAVLVSNLGPSPLRTAVFAAARSVGSVTVEFVLGCTPGDVRSERGLSARVRRKLQQAPSTVDLVRSLVARKVDRAHVAVVPDVRVVAGAAMRERHARLVGTVVPAHSLDWDTYLIASGARPRAGTQRPYALYLDQEMGFHPDYRVTHLRVPIRPRGFYRALNRYFRRLEDESGLEVVVAAHPRADRSRLARRLPGWRVSDRPTVEAVAGASLVLTHNSTAASFAAAWRRPLVVLADGNLLRSWEGPFTVALAESLGAPVDMIDGELAPTVPTRVDEARYDGYVRDYLTEMPDDRRPSWAIVAESLAALVPPGSAG